MQKIFYQGNRRKLLPNTNNTSRLRSFFDCAAALMSAQLQELLLTSMTDFTQMISQNPVRANTTDLHMELFKLEVLREVEDAELALNSFMFIKMHPWFSVGSVPASDLQQTHRPLFCILCT